MPEYLDLPLETSPEQLVEDSIEYLQAQLPGWLPAEGNLEVWVLEAAARQAAETRELTTQVPRAIFRYFGATVAGIPPIDAIAATVPSTWTLVNTDGYTITAGTVVGLATSGDDVHPFAVLTDVVVPSGEQATDAGAVTLVATDTGAGPNGIASGTTAQLLDTLEFVQTVETTDTVSGGIEAETDDEYLGRLASELQLLAPRPIVPEDFATLARSTPGVTRAIAIDGYDATAMTTGNERTITVAVIDDMGADVSTALRAQVDDLLQGEREVNFLVYVVSPTRVGIDVTMTGVKLAEWTIADVTANVEASIAEFLDPALWGLPQGGDVLRWLDERTVRYLDLAAQITSSEGLDYISTLTLAVTGDTLESDDVAMVGVPVLPSEGSISVTIT